MRKIQSRTNSPYKTHYLKNIQQTPTDFNNQNEQNEGLNSLYFPQQEVEVQSPYIRRRIIPLSANRESKIHKKKANDLSYDLKNVNQPLKFSSQADLSQSITDQIKECQRTPVIFTKLPQKQFVLKKIDMQKVYSNQKKSFDYSNIKASNQALISNDVKQSTKLIQLNEIKDQKQDAEIRQNCKVQQVFDNSQYTTDDQSDEIELTDCILQQIKIEENIESRSLTQPSQKIKPVTVPEGLDSDSDCGSEEEYNIWPDNPEILMRGIDFENFTDNLNNPLLPQVLYKVRSIFYSQIQQINSAVTKQTKNCKQNQNICKQFFDYIPCDKKIQQDFQTLKEFAVVQKKRKKCNQERVGSPKKFKNHFVVQLEREKFFQNIQIYQNFSQTPQFINFLQHAKSFRKTEQMKQRPLKYQRYPLTSLNHIETQQSISKRIKSSSSNQGTPRNHFSITRNKQANPSNFSQFMKIDNSVQSSFNNNFIRENATSSLRCSSNLKKRNLSSMNSSNNQPQLQKLNTQINNATPDYLYVKSRQVKHKLQSVLDEIIFQQKN
ncbi:hypothetical protein TTHERM_00471140 (macronuclear) [Tetrahymena thermophila SB210]|uniref:Uncharacterized protein n=1 Tax=Tetrahymena thermophila (strain SB210) TaxID=312017 RepID=I7M022_TETTS|nr:hypothetical protein TTHERM_00471140 [Tetrahymena thermophila SB210]EAR85341.1 hypothetical protein TTHERM_00471140 [Tetrahymena thermophila SB210]|eukprot:XP_001033004.1 hypothetical protein TTHERM_00471140 [Tetrahymena thermophila SB210]